MKNALLMLYCSKCSFILPAAPPLSKEVTGRSGETPVPPCPFGGPAHSFAPINSTDAAVSVANDENRASQVDATIQPAAADVLTAPPTSASLRQHNAAMDAAAKGRSSGRSGETNKSQNAYTIPKRLDISPRSPPGPGEILEIPVVHWQSMTRATVPLCSRPIAAILASGASASRNAPTATYRDFRSQIYRQFAHVLGSPTASIFCLPFGVHIDDRIPVTAANFACVMEPFLQQELEATPPVVLVFDDEAVPGVSNGLQSKRRGARDSNALGVSEALSHSQGSLAVPGDEVEHTEQLQMSASSHHSSYSASYHSAITTASIQSNNATDRAYVPSLLIEQLAVRDGRRCLICRVDDRLVAAFILSSEDVSSAEELYQRFGILSLDCPQNCITLCKECRAKYDDYTFGIDPRGNVVSRRGHTWVLHGEEGNVLRLSPSEMHLRNAFPNEHTLGWKYQKFLLHASRQAKPSASAPPSGISGAISSMFFISSPEDDAI